MAATEPSALAAAVMGYVRALASAAVDREQVGPFLMRLNRLSPSIHFNYALPDDGAAPEPEEIEELVRRFQERDRRPHVESIADAAPELAPRLEARGFHVETALPLMVCTPAQLIRLQPPEPVRFCEPSSDAELLAMATLQHRVFAEPDPPPMAAEVERARSSLRSGGALLTAVAGDTVVAAGMAAPPHGGTREIVGVAVDEGWRRRGIAGALVAELCGRAFAAGDPSVFLEAERGAGNAYARAGFAPRLEVVHHVL